MTFDDFRWDLHGFCIAFWIMFDHFSSFLHGLFESSSAPLLGAMADAATEAAIAAGAAQAAADKAAEGGEEQEKSLNSI